MAGKPPRRRLWWRSCQGSSHGTSREHPRLQVNTPPSLPGAGAGGTPHPGGCAARRIASMDPALARMLARKKQQQEDAEDEEWEPTPKKEATPPPRD